MNSLPGWCYNPPSERLYAADCGWVCAACYSVACDEYVKRGTECCYCFVHGPEQAAKHKRKRAAE